MPLTTDPVGQEVTSADSWTPRIRRETTVTLKWITEPLAMGS